MTTHQVLPPFFHPLNFTAYACGLEKPTLRPEWAHLGEQTMADVYQINEAQLAEVNSALLTGAGACTVHAPEVRDTLIRASMVLDDIVDDAEFASQKPFSTYPEDREKLLALAAKAADSDDASAIELADLVTAILSDEAA